MVDVGRDEHIELPPPMLSGLTARIDQPVSLEHRTVLIFFFSINPPVRWSSRPREQWCCSPDPSLVVVRPDLGLRTKEAERDMSEPA